MSWTDIKNRYEDGGTAATQSTEDMAARRILNALGLTENTLPAAEKAAGVSDLRHADTTLLERAEAIATATTGVRGLPAVRDVLHLGRAMDIAIEMAEQGRPCPWLVHKVRNGEHLMAVRKLPTNLVDIAEMPLPCQLLRSKDGSCVMQYCDARDLYNKLLRAASGKA